MFENILLPIPVAHKFPYVWKLSDGYPELNAGNVFSCFACGGGSTMGYKLAGFNVLGCNEIDPKMISTYVKNHHPKYHFLEPIQEFKSRTNLPDELYELDILDGSPPCSSFSMAGNRGKDWGKEKVFREGQAMQVLDTLFFDFIDLADRLKPKIVVAENVKGLMMGAAYPYVKAIYKAFNKIGYSARMWLLNASTLGVPQRRERVFFCAIRKDLAEKMKWGNSNIPELNMHFNEPEIPYKNICTHNEEYKLISNLALKWWTLCKPGYSLSSVHPKSHWFNAHKLDLNRVIPTITASGHHLMHPEIPRVLTKTEVLLAGSFPLDYDFNGQDPRYLVGMSVPPVMTAQVATRIKEQWLNKLR